MIRWSSFAILAALLAATAPGICADVTWTRGNNTDLWADAANWTSNPALPGTTDNVIFDSTGSGALVSLGATARTVGSITFNRSGGFMVTGGSAALSLSGGITQFLGPDGVYRENYNFTTDISSRSFAGKMDSDTVDMQVIKYAAMASRFHLATLAAAHAAFCAARGTAITTEQAGEAGAADPGEVGDMTALMESFSDQQVIAALGQLPPDQRLALLLVDVEQLDHQEVADILETPVGTIKRRLHVARKRLARELATTMV